MMPIEQRRTCGDCRFLKDLERSQNGLTEYVGACVVEVFRAALADDPELALTCAELYEAWSEDEACADWEEQP